MLHHFFLERYPDPGAWFERRLAYVRTTAVSSMAGYIIGLGDRHSNNILIDERSAEVIHIDLVLHLSRGSFSSIPEMVPFQIDWESSGWDGSCRSRRTNEEML